MPNPKKPCSIPEPRVGYHFISHILGRMYSHENDYPAVANIWVVYDETTVFRAFTNKNAARNYRDLLNSNEPPHPVYASIVPVEVY